MQYCVNQLCFLNRSFHITWEELRISKYPFGAASICVSPPQKKASGWKAVVCVVVVEAEIG